MGRTSSITMPSMVRIVGRAPTVDQKVIFCLFVTLSNDKVCDNGNAIKQCNCKKTIIVSLHRGRFVVVHLYSSFPIDPQNFSRGANFYQKLPLLPIWSNLAWKCSPGTPSPGKSLYKLNKGIYPFWGKFIPKITIFGNF